RSQMAAALLAREAGGAIRGTSVGIAREGPKPLRAGPAEAAGSVLTMGCGEACPVFPGKRYLVWELPAPAGLTVEQVRPIRDDIAGRVRALVAELGVQPAGGCPQPAPGTAL